MLMIIKNLFQKTPKSSLSLILLITITIEAILILNVISKVEANQIEKTTEYFDSNIYKTNIQEDTWYHREEINKRYSPELFEFYLDITKNHQVTEAIIIYSMEFDIPLHLAFSIAYVESRYIPTAIGPYNRNGTRDWGLFQLNDAHRNWTRQQFFDIRLNTREGLSYLRTCINHTNSYVEAIGAYNKGLTGVANYGIPEKYVDLVLGYESYLDERFNAYIK